MPDNLSSIPESHMEERENQDLQGVLSDLHSHTRMHTHKHSFKFFDENEWFFLFTLKMIIFKLSWDVSALKGNYRMYSTDWNYRYEQEKKKKIANADSILRLCHFPLRTYITLCLLWGKRKCTFLMIKLMLRDRKTFAKTPCPSSLGTLETRRVLLCRTTHPPDWDRTLNKKYVHTDLVRAVFHCCGAALGEPLLKLCPQP